MLNVNDLQKLKCNKSAILKELAITLSPYAPFITEELWNKLGNNESVTTATFPKFEASYLIESNHTYPVSFNGKMRFTLDLPLDLSKDQIEEAVMNHEYPQKWLDGYTPKKVVNIKNSRACSEGHACVYTGLPNKFRTIFLKPRC